MRSIDRIRMGLVAACAALAACGRGGGGAETSRPRPPQDAPAAVGADARDLAGALATLEDPSAPREARAAAARAAGDAGGPDALPALIRALVRDDEIHGEVRAALTLLGPRAVPRAIDVLLERDADALAVAREPERARTAPGALVFKGALLLGDLRASEAVPALLAGLRAESRVAFVEERTGVPGPSTHLAILDALHRIGDPAAAPAIAAYALGDAPGAVAALRPRAIEVHGWIAVDAATLPRLLEETTVRVHSVLPFSAAVAVGRIGRTSADAAAVDAAIVTCGLGGGRGPGPFESRGEFEHAILCATLQEARAAVALAGECGDDAVCFAAALARVGTSAAVDLGRAPDVPDPDRARADRALVELYRLGPRGRAALPQLLAALDSRDRAVRAGVLLALPRVAPAPCAECRDRLRQIVEAEEGQRDLAPLAAEARIVLHYYLARNPP